MIDKESVANVRIKQKFSYTDLAYNYYRHDSWNLRNKVFMQYTSDSNGNIIQDWSITREQSSRIA